MKNTSFLLAILISLYLMEAFAETGISGQANIIAKDILINKKKIEAAELKERKVLTGLFFINKAIKKTVTKRGDYDRRRTTLEVNIEEITAKVKALEVKTQSQKRQLAERLRAIYKLGSPNLARYIFSSNSSYMLERNLKILGLVAKRDLDLIRNYDLDLKELTSKRKVLAQRLESLKLVDAKISIQEKKLLKEQEYRAKILNGVRKSQSMALQQIHGLREKSKKTSIEDSGVFDALFKASFAEQKGNLPRPLEGVVIRKFGLIKGKDHPYTITNKGVFISSGVGTAVKSVFDGKVSFVGDVPGLGRTLILDHGDHYYTVYGHTQNVRVNIGDEVKQAQTIAATGPESLLESFAKTDTKVSGMYFEIRHFSEPYDPQQWMKGL